MFTSTITQKGQVTIPKKLRDELHLQSNDQVVFVKQGDYIIIKPVQDIMKLKGSVKVKSPLNFSKIRDQVKKQQAKHSAHE